MRTKTITFGIKYEGIKETFKHNLYLVADKYINNDTLGINVIEVNEDGEEDYFDTITVNFPCGSANETHAYIDTNNCPWAESLLKRHKFAKPTGKSMTSGFCTYPLYEFDLTKFSE